MPYRDRPVVAFTPWGRRLTASILYEYLAAEHRRGLVDRWMLWLNLDPTGQEDDLAYAEELASNNSWIELRHHPEGAPRFEPKQRNTGQFYVYCDDPEAVYVRFDDDIVYVHPRAVPNMIDRVLDRPDSLACFATIINNAIVTWAMQAHHKVPAEWGLVGEHCMDPVGWADPYFAEQLHRLLLERIDGHQVESLFWWPDHPLGRRTQFSVSCFAIRGSQLTRSGGELSWNEEEHWLTMHEPGIVNRTNYVAGDAIVSHFSFFPQRDYLLSTGLLDRYRSLAERINERQRD